MTNNLFNFHLKIYGKVQGVGFRAWTKKTAENLFLTGWVKNCDDKSVECEVSGKKENIDFFFNCLQERSFVRKCSKYSKKTRMFQKI